MKYEKHKEAKEILDRIDRKNALIRDVQERVGHGQLKSAIEKIFDFRSLNDAEKEVFLMVINYTISRIKAEVEALQKEYEAL